MISNHASDCSIYNGPAEPAGPCDCGYELKVQRRYVSCAWRLFCNQAVRLQTRLRSRVAR